MNCLQNLFRSPEYYPLRVDFDNRSVTFVRMSRETYRDSVFLDMRTRHLGATYTLRLDDVILAASSGDRRPLRATYILHPAFCCSTLLARYFELLSSCLVLKEPLLLTQVALSSCEPTSRWTEAFDCSVKLLTRGYHETEWIIIKAHEPCNVLGRRLLQGDDRTTVIFLMTPQRHFMLSVLKSNERRTWVRSRACSVLAKGVADSGWDDAQPRTLTDAQAAAFMWTMNNGLRQQLSNEPERSRVFLLDSDQLVDYPEETLTAIASSFQHPLENKQIADMVGHSSMRKYSKDRSRYYDAATRRQEIAQLEERFGTEVDAGVEWASCHIKAATMA
jgi:hypothetical protein